MKPVITPEESARLDASAADPVDTLMDRAGLAVAIAAVEMGAGYGSRVAVLVGPGNNGGDGYIAARHLVRRGAAVRVHALGFPKGEHSPARQAASAAVAAGVRVVQLGEPESADLVVDAVFGAGFHGELPGPVASWSRAAPRVLAVDVPSGLDAATGTATPGTFRAERTVTFGALKVGHLLGDGPDRCGQVSVVDIGLGEPRPTLRLCEAGDAPRPHRPRSAHKWSAGSVLVAGGSPGLTGAPVLAADAALHFGAGAVAIACPGALASIYEAGPAQLMTVAVGKGDRFGAADAPALLEAAARYDVLALGPGLGRGGEDFVVAVVAGRSGRLHVDADGLNALPGPEALAARDGDTVLTPHAGEFRRLAGAEPGYREAKRYADLSRATVLLKGNPTLVAGGDLWVVASGGPELATIGTGDVLTGMVAALWSRGLASDVAARSGAYWHGVAAADLADAGGVTAGTLAGHAGRFAFAGGHR